MSKVRADKTGDQQVDHKKDPHKEFLTLSRRAQMQPSAVLCNQIWTSAAMYVVIGVPNTHRGKHYTEGRIYLVYYRH